jgi:hypothetical protein
VSLQGRCCGHGVRCDQCSGAGTSVRALTGTIGAAILVADVYATVGAVSYTVVAADVGLAETLRRLLLRAPLRRLAWVSQ